MFDLIVNIAFFLTISVVHRVFLHSKGKVRDPYKSPPTWIIMAGRCSRKKGEDICGRNNVVRCRWRRLLHSVIGDVETKPPNRMTISVEPVRCRRVDGTDGLTGYNQEEKESSVRMYLSTGRFIGTCDME
ncbi:hypothetical protein pipiens_019200 [Culex pipiens pipiens]|uniref:Secreted protein n=1 Tax=Culex pipiens pipiens TaxID=38569 RepID=A0ABD1DVY8_CULPP